MSAIRTLAVNHLARTTRRLDESRAFYRDLLGFKEINRPGFNFRGAWLYKHGLQSHLIVDDSAPEAKGEISTRADHLALHVDDIAEVERLLEQQGVAFRKNYVAERDLTQLFFHDPDGHHIEVGTYPTMTEAPMVLGQA